MVSFKNLFILTSVAVVATANPIQALEKRNAFNDIMTGLGKGLTDIPTIIYLWDGQKYPKSILEAFGRLNQAIGNAIDLTRSDTRTTPGYVNTVTAALGSKMFYYDNFPTLQRDLHQQATDARWGVDFMCEEMKKRMPDNRLEELNKGCWATTINFVAMVDMLA
ncbi:hypothetical protein Tdes44962_MAKER01189 [Teratosphaeria destructans]|uniref:Uncharacterized protein n=1 Tax=Teratosphaeria destructans TaxID=418781 RepID=A0A9W7T235_9PEZI|nr:hypothetical protein Tdes44962_MAKER01189 [Teratosphaeria destructans]